MHQRISKKIVIYFFLLIIVSSINNSSINNLKLNKTQNIYVSGLSEKDNQILLNERYCKIISNYRLSFPPTTPVKSCQKFRRRITLSMTVLKIVAYP